MDNNITVIPAMKNDGEIGVKIKIALTNVVPSGMLTRSEDMLAFWNSSTGKSYSGFSYVDDFSSIDNYVLECEGKLILLKELIPTGPLVYDLCACSHRVVSMRGRIAENNIHKLTDEGHTICKVGQYSFQVENYKDKLIDWGKYSLHVLSETGDIDTVSGDIDTVPGDIDTVPDDIDTASADKVSKLLALKDKEIEILKKTIEVKDQQIKILEEMLKEKE